MNLAIGVLGAGAIGSAIATRLSAAGNDVTLFARGARLGRLRRTGLVLHGAGGTVRATPALASEAPPDTLDALLVAVKAQDLVAALLPMLPALRPGGALIPLVNGLPWWYPLGRPGGPAAPVDAVDPGGRLLNAIAPGRIIGSVVFLRASLDAEGAVLSAAGERLVLGAIAEPPPHHLPAMASMMDRSGIATRISDNIRADLWTKIALNLATNPLSVVCGATLDKMFHDPKLLPLVVAMLRETESVAIADGVPPASGLDAMTEVGRQAGAFMTSMAQDQEAGRPLELAAIADAVLDLGRRHRCAMPVVQTVADLARYRAAEAATQC